MVGRDGRTLADHWQGSPQAYDTVTVHGFPNLFLLLGPNSGLGHNSVVVMAEAGDRPPARGDGHLRATGAAALEPTAAAQAAFVRRGRPPDAGQRLDGRRLPQLVPRPDRPQLRPVARASRCRSAAGCGRLRPPDYQLTPRRDAAAGAAA